MTARLPTGLEVSAWRRAVEAAGGCATILAKGEPDAGTVLLLTIESGGNARLWERLPQLDGSRPFSQLNIQNIETAEVLQAYLDRRRTSDPDLWIVELDIPKPERFVDLRLV